ncbi:MAG: STAS domain-containing protein [Telluria sp.]|nr:STAS domain-containing protein [Telluria sp.]
MRAPVLKQGKYLIGSIQASLGDADLLALRDELTRTVREQRSTGVVIDVTLLDVLDSFAARTLRSISQMIRLLGAETVIVGIQPEVAVSMIQLGLTIEGAATALDLEEGIALLDARTGRGARGRAR